MEIMPVQAWTDQKGKEDPGVQKFKNECIKYKEKLLKYGKCEVKGEDELKVEGKHKWNKAGQLHLLR